MNKNLLYITICLFTLLAAGCRDELTLPQASGDGTAEVNVTVDFKPMSTALDRSRSAGNSLKEITGLHVVLYDYDTKQYLKSWKLAEGSYEVSDENRTDADAEGDKSAEAETKRATFKLPERIAFGRYYMFAVANVPTLTDNLSAIDNVDKLKQFSLVWDSDNVANNGQMMGCITKSTSLPPADGSDPVLELNQNVSRLHAWLRRAASKVTVAFDGSGLKDGVSIYFKSLRIKNIPIKCKLGDKNTAAEGDVLPDGEEVIYTTSTSFDQHHPALITNACPYYPRVRSTAADGQTVWIKDPASHSETSPNSLFFYENMQGKGPDKRQKDFNNDGILDNLYEFEKMPQATYIEVDAHYESRNPERPGICNITYRFMLGQNIIDDYDARRNCHYKLTLCFNGFADEPDWRIDYVSRLWAQEPKRVDYRGKYFVPQNNINNRGHIFSDKNVIKVNSFMYINDSWSEREPMDFDVAYRDVLSNKFSDTPPSWLKPLEKKETGNGNYELAIGYNNPVSLSLDINQKLLSNPYKTGSNGFYDLSTKGGSAPMNTANCYIVDSRGIYQFPLVYGNAIKNGSTNKEAYIYQGSLTGDHYLNTFLNYDNKPISGPYILDDIYGSSTVPSNLNVELLWQDEPGLVSNVSYRPQEYGGKGGIRFEVGSGIKEGNALIAVKDPSNKIMWSWHIWVTAIDLNQNISLTNSVGKFEIMPVNLGWCSGGTPVLYFDRRECEVKITQKLKNGQEGVSQIVKIIQEPHIALPKGNNPVYQWGRKDPFIAGGETTGSTKKWYNSANPTGSQAGPTLMYNQINPVETWKATASLIQNPTKWQDGPHKENPDTTKFTGKYIPLDNIYFNLWDNRLHQNDPYITKTVYDPCPSGYHVSSPKTFYGFTEKEDDVGIASDILNYMYAATEENMMPDSQENYKSYRDGIFEFYIDRDTKLLSLGFPMNGYRDWDDFANYLTPNMGYIWHAQSFIWGDNFDNYGKFNAYNFQYYRTHDAEGNPVYTHIWPATVYYATDGFPVRPTITK